MVASAYLASIRFSMKVNNEKEPSSEQLCGHQVHSSGVRGVYDMF